MVEKTDITNTAAPAPDGTIPYALHADGMTLKIDAATIRSFGMGELVVLADAIESLRDVLNAAIDHPAVNLPADDPELAKHGVKKGTPAEQFLDDVYSWFSWLGDLVNFSIAEKKPEESGDALRRCFALLKREALLRGGSHELLALTKIAVEGLAEVQDLEREENRRRMNPRPR